MRLASLLCLAAVCPIALACDASEPPSAAVAVRDSAGIRLVESAVGSEAPTPLEVELAIGPDPTRPETGFGHIADLAVGADGAIYVLDRVAGRIVVFEPDGRTREVIGRPGEGPGELSGFAWSLVLQGEALAVVDWGRGLLHRFAAAGSYLNASRLPMVGSARSWWRGRRGGGFLARVLERYTDEADRWRGRDVLVRLTAGAEVADTALVFEYAESDLGGPGDARVPLIVNAPMWTELGAGRIAWTTLASDRVRVHAPDGTLQAILGHDAWIRRPAPEAEREVLRTALREKIEDLGGDGSAVDAFPLVWPERYPAITGLAAGPDGTLWVQRMGRVEDIHPSALNSPDPPRGFGGSLWDVFDEELRLSGTFELPTGFRLYRITDDGLYGVTRDALDRETVVRLAPPDA